MRTVNRYEQIYREASVRPVQDSDSSLHGSNPRIFETGYEFLKNVSLRMDSLLIFLQIPPTFLPPVAVTFP